MTGYLAWFAQDRPHLKVKIVESPFRSNRNSHCPVLAVLGSPRRLLPRGLRPHLGVLAPDPSYCPNLLPSRTPRFLPRPLRVAAQMSPCQRGPPWWPRFLTPYACPYYLLLPLSLQLSPPVASPPPASDTLQAKPVPLVPVLFLLLPRWLQTGRP